MSLKCVNTNDGLHVLNGTVLLSNVAECSWFCWFNDAASNFVFPFWLSVDGSGSANEYISLGQHGSSPFEYAAAARPLGTDTNITVFTHAQITNSWFGVGARWKNGANPAMDAYCAGTKYAGSGTVSSNMGGSGDLDSMYLFKTPIGQTASAKMAYLTIWNKQLSDAEFTSLMSSTNPGSIQSSSIVFYETFVANTSVAIPVGYTAWTVDGGVTIDADNPTTTAAAGGGGGTSAKLLARQYSIMRNA